jgi:rod shape-determining protein MreC
VRGRLQGALRSSVAAPLVSAQAWAQRGRLAITDHGRLATQVDSLALGAQTADPLRAENERLRAILGLGQRLQWGFVATEIVHPPRGADEHTVLLAAGAAAGVRPFSPLVVPEGLIGMVTTVDASSSTAILWTHPDFRASATTADGVAFGIVAAHLGSGADRFLLEMRGVPFRDVLKPGTLIVSSGLGNVFPRGIPIGVVLRETKTVEGWARTYLLRPIVSPDQASAAAVLLPPRAAAGVTGAWISASTAEATQKSIALAGDSLIADSVRAMQSKLAQLSLLDSLRRVAIYRGDSGVRVDGDAEVVVRPTPATSAPSDSLPPPGSAALPVPAAVPLPRVATPIATAPRVATPIAAAPRVAAPIATAPRVATPIATAPRAATPVVSAPRAAAPVVSAPRVVPPSTGVPRATAAPSTAVATGGAATTATRTTPRPRAPRVRRDTAAVRASAGVRNDVAKPRAKMDSASAKKRTEPARPPADNPFRLPPAGGPA